MKKAIMAFVLLCLCRFSTSHAFDLLIESKTALLHPTGNEFQDIYGDGGLFGGEITAILPKGLAVWGSVDYYSKTGHSKNTHSRGGNKTDIRLIPVAFGLKYFYPLCVCDYEFAIYGGAGLQWNFVQLKDDHHFGKKEINKNGVGGIYKLGALFKLPCDIVLDVFMNYANKEMDFKDSHHSRAIRLKADISYFAIGFGLGYDFNFDDLWGSNDCVLWE